MSVRSMIFTVAAAITVAGCQTQQQMMDQQQPDARHVAQRRGAFELNCPAATAELLSKGIVPQPAFAIAEIAPPQRAEYTVVFPDAESGRPTSSSALWRVQAVSRRARAT